MFAGALALLSLGYPVAFALGGVAISLWANRHCRGRIRPGFSHGDATENFRHYEQLYAAGNSLLYFYGGNAGEVWDC